MTTGDRRRSYRPGGWFGIFGDNASVMLPPTEKRRVTALWEMVDEGAGFDEVLDGLLSSGLRELPAFVLVSQAAGMTKVVLRGPAVAAFVVDGDMIELAGSTDTTWVERSLAGVTQMFVQVEATDEEDGEDLLIENGLVRLGRIDQPPFRLEESSDTADEPGAVAASEGSDDGSAVEAGEDTPDDSVGLDAAGLGAAGLGAAGLGAAGALGVGETDSGGDGDAESSAHESVGEEVSVAETVAEEVPLEETVAEEVPAESTEVEVPPVLETPDDEAPADEAYAEQAPDAGAQAEDVSGAAQEVSDGDEEVSGEAEEVSGEAEEVPDEAAADEGAGDESPEAVAEPTPEPWGQETAEEHEPDGSSADDAFTADESPMSADGDDVPAPEAEIGDPGSVSADEAPHGDRLDLTPEDALDDTVVDYPLAGQSSLMPPGWEPLAAQTEDAQTEDAQTEDAQAEDAQAEESAVEDVTEESAFENAAPSWGAPGNFAAPAGAYPAADEAGVSDTSVDETSVEDPGVDEAGVEDTSIDEPAGEPEEAATPEETDHDGLTGGGWQPAAWQRPQPAAPAEADEPTAGPTSPVIARLVFSSGEAVEVDRPILVGRAPEVRRFAAHDQPRLVPVPSPHQEISSTHLEVRPGLGADHGSAVVTDLGSTNGTVLVQPGLPPEDLQPGIAVQLVPGAIIDLGDGVTIQVTQP